MKIIKKLVLFVLFNLVTFCFGQEALTSFEYEYYDFLKLNGAVQKQSMIYQTLSDNKFTFDAENSPFESNFPWKNENIGISRTVLTNSVWPKNIFANGISSDTVLKVYGFEEFLSYNSRAPYGQNDGALWQGRGLNTSLTAGLRFESYGFEFTLKPQITYSQNLGFETQKPYNSTYHPYSHYGSNGIDAPQRFGDSDFITFDWGDSEIRWNYYTFTVGFGTQHVWSGPSRENSMILSNNAATFPKFDFGLRPTNIKIPYFDWNLGKIEARLFYGKLHESEYFDSIPDNDENMLTGMTLAYSFPFAETLTLGFTKVCISRWNERFWKYVNPFYSNNTVRKYIGEDQFAALYADWLFPKSNLEIYGEIAVDDFLANGLKFYEYARYPFHAVAYTVGLQKSFTMSENHKVYGVLGLEWNNSEPSQDYQMWVNSNFNFGSHYQIKQGKTNLGQYLGSGIGYGGNSQILSFKVYSPHGYDKFLIGRNNPDNGYIFNKFVDNVPSNTNWLAWDNFAAFKANFFVGYETMWFVTPEFSVARGFLYDLIINPHFKYNSRADKYEDTKIYWNNYRGTLRLKYQI